MSKSRSEEPPRPGLRERKKARTRAAIQRHALRLFREQGYAETTIEQIAEAAEVSPSTFFRYFPTKEDVVLYDDLDPIMLEQLGRQPPDLSPLAALRNTIRTVYGTLAGEERADQDERLALMRAVPEVRARALEQISNDLHLLTEALAHRLGRPPDDFHVHVFSGAVAGVAIAVMLHTIDDPDADPAALLDEGLAQLEAGLPL